MKKVRKPKEIELGDNIYRIDGDWLDVFDFNDRYRESISLKSIKTTYKKFGRAIAYLEQERKKK